MRLIDADILIAELEDAAKDMEDENCKCMTYAAINDVKRQPTIDMDELRKAKMEEEKS